MSERWLKCNIFKGMFSDERVIVVAISVGEDVSAFVHSKWVEGTPEHPGRVKVRVLEEKDRAWVVLPNEGQTVIGVEPSELAIA